MRPLWLGLVLGAATAAEVVGACGCSREKPVQPDNAVPWGTARPVAASTPAPPVDKPLAPPAAQSTGGSVGFDRNTYPGDEPMQRMHASFAFTGYWLTPPPGASTNTWAGKREILKRQGWGFLLLANGRLDAEILNVQKRGTAPDALGRKDAAVAIASAQAEHFPKGAIIFLDQEEGGRLLDEQAAYLLAWTEAVAVSDYKPGVYASGQPVADEPGTTIDTIQDIRARVKQGHLHEIAMFDAQDACPPAPGCTLQAKPLSAAGEPDLTAWQYSQSPRRPNITKSCAKTYASDGNCYAPGMPNIFLDMDVAGSDDPSHGR